MNNWKDKRIKANNRKRVNNMAKKYLVKFNCIVGEYEHLETYIFDKQMTEYQYCKKFWGLEKKHELKTNVFWDNFMENAIEVYSEIELTTDQYNTMQKLGVA